jgi:hypothetical protein
MLDELVKLEPNMVGLSKDMEKSPSMKKTELKDSPRVVRECLQDIQSIIRKKNLMFKVNKHLEELVSSTRDQVEAIRSALGNAGDTKILCCGTEYILYYFQWNQEVQVDHLEVQTKLHPVGAACQPGAKGQCRDLCQPEVQCE